MQQGPTLIGDKCADFNTLHTAVEIKARYRDLAKKYHPDLGGDPEIMKAVNAAYHADLKGCDGCKTDAHTYKYKQDIEQELKKALKQSGLLWHAKRKCWYYKPKDWKRSYHSTHSLEEIAQKYGYKKFQTVAKDYMPTATQS